MVVVCQSFSKMHRATTKSDIWISDTKSILYRPFRMMIIPLQVFGMYPINGLPKWLYYLHAGFLHCILTLSLPVLVLVYLFANNDLNARVVMDALFMFSEIGITIFKYITIRLYPEDTRKTLQWLENDIFNTYYEDHKQIVEQTSRLCRNTYIYFVTTCVITMLTWCIRPLFYEERSLQTAMWLPYDPFKNSYIYYFTLFFIFLCIANACFGNSSIDCLIAGLVCQSASQIKLIKAILRDVIKHANEYISKFGHNLSKDEQYRLKNEYIYNDICKCVDRYNLIKDFVNDIEATFSMALFWQFGASIFVICLGFVQFLFVELWTFDFFTIVSFVITMSWEVFLYCYYGSLLFNESDTLITDIYITNWFDLELKCQKAYLLIMENGKKPIVIKAGKIIDLSLDTFATIIRRSYSVLAIISKLIDN